MADIQTTQPSIRTDNALEQPLGGALLTSLTANTPYFRYGSGASLLPTAPMGQIAMPGPNQSVFGNPFAGDVGHSFGYSPSPPTPYQMLGSGGSGGGYGGGYGYGAPSQISPFALLAQSLFGSINPMSSQMYSGGSGLGFLGLGNLQNYQAPAPPNYGSPSLPAGGGK